MKTILIVYHSLAGGTRQMADAAARGAEAQTAVQVHLLQAREAGPNDVLNADGYIFATPENLAAMGGIMKDFFDRTYYPVLDRVNGRPYAVLICAGSDGQNAARQIERIATGWRLRAIRPDHCLYTRTDSRGDFRAEVDPCQRAPPVRGAWFCLIRRSNDGDFLMVPLQKQPLALGHGSVHLTA